MPTADRVGIDVVTARHYALLNAQFVDVSRRREQEHELHPVTNVPCFIDKPPERPSCQCSFDAERPPPFKKRAASAQNPASSLNRNRVDIRWD
jgi:hypothetical protein